MKQILGSWCLIFVIISFIIRSKIVDIMANNVHGFNQLNNNQNQPNNQFNQVSSEQMDRLPFIGGNRSDRPALQQTIPYTLKIICCPDLKTMSISLVYLLALWVMYIFCCTQGITQKNNDVLEIQGSVLQRYGASVGTLIKNGEVYRLLTAMFLTKDLLNIVMGSVYLLFMFTRFQKLHTWQTIVIAIGSAFSGFLFGSLCEKDAIIVGSATPIYGIMGGFVAYLIINWQYLARYGQIRSSICCIIVVILVISLIFSIGPVGEMVSHFGGLFAGFSLGIAILPGLGQKWKFFTYIGLGIYGSMNLIMLLVLFLSD